MFSKVATTFEYQSLSTLTYLNIGRSEGSGGGGAESKDDGRKLHG
jgi:hypothetical protein